MSLQQQREINKLKLAVEDLERRVEVLEPKKGESKTLSLKKGKQNADDG